MVVVHTMELAGNSHKKQCAMFGTVERADRVSENQCSVISLPSGGTVGTHKVIGETYLFAQPVKRDREDEKKKICLLHQHRPPAIHNATHSEYSAAPPMI